MLQKQLTEIKEQLVAAVSTNKALQKQQQQSEQGTSQSVSVTLTLEQLDATPTPEQTPLQPVSKPASSACQSVSLQPIQTVSESAVTKQIECKYKK